MEDKEIIDLYWERSEKAIAATIEKYGNYCRSIAYNILHNKEDVEECINDTCLRAWDAMPPERPECLSVYLGKITRNLALNRVKYYEAKKRGMGQVEQTLEELEECIPTGFDVEQQIDERILVNTVEDFLMKQPCEQRNIFIRRYWYMMSIKEISGAYEMKESRVMSILFRMRKRLKKYLEKEGICI